MNKKKKINGELLKKEFITEEASKVLEERLRKETEKKKAAFREQLYNEIRSYKASVTY